MWKEYGYLDYSNIYIHDFIYRPIHANSYLSGSDFSANNMGNLYILYY